MSDDITISAQNQAVIRTAARSANLWLVASTLGLVVCAFALVLLGLLDWPSPEPNPYPVSERTMRDGSWMSLGLAAAGLISIAFLLALIGFSTGQRADHRWWLLGAFVVFGVATIAAGWLQVHFTLKAFRAVRMEEQISVARQKAVQIDEWTTERLIDLRFLVDTLKGFALNSGTTKPEAAALGELVLAQFLAAYPERVAVGVFRQDGQPVIALGNFSPLLAGQLKADIAETASRNKPYIGIIQPGGVRETGLSLAFLAPVGKANALPADRLVAVSIVDPTISLLKKFSEWPLSGKGVVTLVFRSEGQLAHIVNAGRQMGSAILPMRAAIPAERLNRVLSDTRGEASWRGIGRDGQQTLTATYTVKDMPWTVEARTDLAEAMAPISRQIWALWVATAVIAIFGGLLMLAVRGQMKLAGLLLEAVQQPKSSTKG